MQIYMRIILVRDYNCRVNKTSRQRLVDFLRSRSTATAVEISHNLQTTPSNVRHHLSQLLEEGVVRIVGERHSSKRGRPTQLYTLTTPFTQHNLDRLSGALLDYTLQNQSPALQAQIIQQVAHQVAAPAPETHQPTQRLNQSIQRLNQMGYQARWEAHANGPRVILGHCPYFAIIAEYPVLCQVDAAMISELTGRTASLEARLEPTSTGLPQCVFRVGGHR